MTTENAEWGGSEMTTATKRKPKSKPKAQVKGCDCIEQADKQLRDLYGAKFVRSLSINFDTGKSSLAGPLLAVEWEDKPRRGKRLPIATCAYCPFCGKEKGGK